MRISTKRNDNQWYEWKGRNQTVGLSQLDALQGLRDSSDLVHLVQNGVAGVHLDTLGEALRVGDEEVISHQLNLGAELLRQLHIAIPVILVQGI